jgi:hypothetical protein
MQFNGPEMEYEMVSFPYLVLKMFAFLLFILFLMLLLGSIMIVLCGILGLAMHPSLLYNISLKLSIYLLVIIVWIFRLVMLVMFPNLTRSPSPHTRTTRWDSWTFYIWMYGVHPQ